MDGNKPMAFGEFLGVHCSAKQAAAYARCSVETIRRWVTEGKLEAHRPVARGSSRLRIVTESLLRLLGEKA